MSTKPWSRRVSRSIARAARRALAVMSLAVWQGPAPGLAHDTHRPATQTPTTPAPANALVRIVDAKLIEARGGTMRFAGDVVNDRIVVMDFIYTSCTTVCPLTSTLLAQVQARLGDRLKRDVRLVTVTIDPATDTPKRLAEYAARFEDGPGWIWLTGRVADVDKVLAGLGVASPAPADHSPLILVGDPAAGLWSHLYGLPAPEEIVARVEALSARRGVAHSGTSGSPGPAR